MIQRAAVLDQWGLMSGGELHVEVRSGRRTQTSPVRARICGACGAVQLYVEDADELWAASQQA
ncbi:MAG TPA: hypothetical protein VGE07_17875 [Herpetosiphonaceae bacterium]